MHFDLLLLLLRHKYIVLLCFAVGRPDAAATIVVDANTHLDVAAAVAADQERPLEAWQPAVRIAAANADGHVFVWRLATGHFAPLEVCVIFYCII